MMCKPKIQKSMVCNRKDNGGGRESKENVYQFLILEISMECHKYEIINEREMIRLQYFYNKS